MCTGQLRDNTLRSCEVRRRDMVEAGGLGGLALAVVPCHFRTWHVDMLAICAIGVAVQSLLAARG